ncbi:hypothetical protein NMS_1907 [Nonlabens marinus S1-08]|uniref:Uncharacterized protein n=1 Tax=Nonlabens marinus S1-08 TaxID=1454201 RepID=W8W091_9FLAO|nr:hypothetical protein NMS_1907 [Nonlabens marinus S1-08]
MNFKPFVRILIPSISLFLAFMLLAFQHMQNNGESNEKQNENELAKIEASTDKDTQGS